MNSFSQLFEKKHIKDMMLVLVFSIYLVMGYPTPEPIAEVVDTLVGKLVIIFVVISLFVYANPIVGVLSLLVAFDLMRRSSLSTGIDALARYAPTESKKTSQFTAFNQFPYTLEQEVVKKMAPILHGGYSMNKATYKPTLEQQHNASPIR
jgi:hypothetical protein